MIRWGEEKRQKDPGFFCRLATSGSGCSKPVWIVSDARRETDLQYFRDSYGHITKFVRVVADQDVRKQRGFIFQKGESKAKLL